jgi:hypothetical protein
MQIVHPLGSVLLFLLLVPTLFIVMRLGAMLGNVLGRDGGVIGGALVLVTLLTVPLALALAPAYVGAPATGVVVNKRETVGCDGQVLSTIDVRHGMATVPITVLPARFDAVRAGQSVPMQVVRVAALGELSGFANASAVERVRGTAGLSVLVLVVSAVALLVLLLRALGGMGAPATVITAAWLVLGVIVADDGARALASARRWRALPAVQQQARVERVGRVTEEFPCARSGNKASAKLMRPYLQVVLAVAPSQGDSTGTVLAIDRIDDGATVRRGDVVRVAYPAGHPRDARLVEATRRHASVNGVANSLTAAALVLLVATGWRLRRRVA